MRMRHSHSVMVYSLLVLIVTPAVFTTVADEECGHSLAKAVKNHVVKDDPITFYGGVLSNVWVQQKEQQNTKCSYSTYFHLPDGTVQEEAFYYNLAGQKLQQGTEIIKKTDTNGILTLWGLDKDSRKYVGKTYLFHADNQVIGFYSCQPGGFMWNMGIQARTKDGVQSDTPTDVMMSLQKAKDTMDEILSEVEDKDDVVMVENTPDRMCFD